MKDIKLVIFYILVLLFPDRARDGWNFSFILIAISIVIKKNFLTIILKTYFLKGQNTKKVWSERTSRSVINLKISDIVAISANLQTKTTSTKIYIIKPEWIQDLNLDLRLTTTQPCPTSSRVFTIAVARDRVRSFNVAHRIHFWALSRQDLVFPREKPILKRGHKLLIPARGAEESINRIDAPRNDHDGWCYLDFTASWWPRMQGEMARFQEPVACHRLLTLRLVINR